MYKKNMGCKAGLSCKLCPLYVGPFIVEVELINDLYHVEGQRKEEIIHQDRLHKCADRALPFWVRHGKNMDDPEEQGVGDTSIPEGVNSDLVETVAFEGDVPEASGETDMSREEVPAVSNEDDEPEWNLGTLFASSEPDESQSDMGTTPFPVMSIWLPRQG